MQLGLGQAADEGLDGRHGSSLASQQVGGRALEFRVVIAELIHFCAAPTGLRGFYLDCFPSVEMLG